MNDNKKGLTGFFKSKGFYIVLIVCVIAAAVSSYLAVETLMDHFVSDGNSFMSESAIPNNDLGAPVDNSQTNVPINPDTEDEDSNDSSAASSSQQEEEDEIVDTVAETDSDSDLDSQTAEIEEEIVETAVEATPAQAVDDTAEEPPSFTMPVSGSVVTEFSGDELVYNNTMNDWRTHNGVDIAAALDTAVMAAVGGEVISVSIDDLWGGVVEIASEDVTIRYCGLNPDIAVQKGQQLRSGEIIGKIGEVPAEIADEPHIHIEAIKGEEYFSFTDLK